jgi:hypothetical protein
VSKQWQEAQVPTNSRAILTGDASAPAGPPAEFLPRKTPGVDWRTMGLLVCVLNVPLAVWGLLVGAYLVSVLVGRGASPAAWILMPPLVFISATVSVVLSLPLSVVAAAGVHRYGRRSMMLAVLITLGLSMLNFVNAIVFYAVTGIYPFRHGAWFVN